MVELSKDKPVVSSAFVVGHDQSDKGGKIMWIDKFKDSSFVEYLRGSFIVAPFVIVLMYLIVMSLVHYYDTFVR